MCATLVRLLCRSSAEMDPAARQRQQAEGRIFDAHDHDITDSVCKYQVRGAFYCELRWVELVPTPVLCAREGGVSLSVSLPPVFSACTCAMSAAHRFCC